MRDARDFYRPSGGAERDAFTMQWGVPTRLAGVLRFFAAAREPAPFQSTSRCATSPQTS
jgi:hypothetical protein